MTVPNSRDWKQLTVSELRSICQKGLGELFVISQYIYRPLTIHITRLYALAGISANAATIHSVIAALVAVGTLLFPGPASFLMAAVGLQIYFLLDHVDGELARLELARGVRTPNPSGEYLDFLVHFHSLNLAFGALGVGLALRLGDWRWAVIGLLADNCLGNFPKLALSRTLLAFLERNPSAARDPEFVSVVASATDSENGKVFTGELPLRRKVFMLVREALFYPGCLVALSVVLTLDAVTAISTGRFAPAWSESYLVLFAAVGIASKLRRSFISFSQLRRLAPSVSAPAIAVLATSSSESVTSRTAS